MKGIIPLNPDMTDASLLHEAKLVEARFRDLLDSMPDGIVLVNATGQIVYANSHAESLFGYSPAGLQGQLVESLMPQRFRGSHVGHRAGYFGHPRARAMGAGIELYGLRRDGTEFPVEISLSPLRLEEATLVVSAIRDTSDRKRIERALQDKNVELENANKAKDRFLASMSHELRTPLNAIIGFTGTLLMKLPGPLNADQEKQLKTVQASGRHLLALINDLLDLAKIDAGKVELELESVEFRGLIEEVASTLRPHAEAKGLELVVGLPQVEVHAQADRRAVSQIVLNLVYNAIKFTDSGRVALTLGRTAGEVEVAVRDTGIGIRPEDHDKLFQAFAQISDPAKGRREGTGLGLHLSEKLARLMDGRIAFSSEHGKGSVFSLFLKER